MGNNVFSSGKYMIISVRNNFVVINKKKGFKEGHTHIRNFKTAKYLISLAQGRRLPNHLSEYLLVSLMRISDDEAYVRKVEALLNVKRNREKQAPVRRIS